MRPGAPISDELEAVIVRALAKKPSERYPSMMAFAEALLKTPEAQGEPALLMSRLFSGDSATRTGDGRAEWGAHGPTQGTARAAASTQLVVAGSTGSRRGLVLAAVAAAALVVVGAVAFFGYRMSLTSEPVAKAEPPGESPAGSTGTGQVQPVLTAAVASSAAVVVEPPDAGVVIHIVTKPDGAVIKKKEGDSLFQVCATSPCDHPARMDEKVELVAEKPGLRGAAAVLARTSQTLLIELHTTRVGVKPRAPGGGARTNNCEFCVPRGDPDCIKVIRPCDAPQTDRLASTCARDRPGWIERLGNWPFVRQGGRNASVLHAARPVSW